MQGKDGSGMTDRIREILLEFAKGCSNGKAGQCTDCLDAAVSAIKTQAGWQPITSAPKDGTWVLLRGGDLDIGYVENYDSTLTEPLAVVGCWDDRVAPKWRVTGGCIMDYPVTYENPTEWMHIPE